MTTASDSGSERPQESGAADAGSMWELLRVALPLMVSAGSQSLMNAADRIILAGCSEEALAAVTPASMLHWTVICIPLGTVLYANTFLSQYEGAGRTERMMSSLWQAIWLALFTGTMLLFCIPWTRTLLAYTGHPPVVVEYEAQYFNTLCAGCPILFVSTALSCFFSGRRKTSIVMLISLVAVSLNFGMDYLLVYGIGPIPELGIRGAALATVAARCVELLIYGVLLVRECRRLSLPLWESCGVDRNLLRQFVRFGIPSGLHFFVDNSGFTAFLMLVGRLSSTALAATNLAFSVNGLIFVPLLGFGTAIQTLVGHHLGSGRTDWARRTTRNAVILGLTWTGLTGALLIAFPQQALWPFFFFADRSDGEGVDIAGLAADAHVLLNFVAVYSVFDALAVVFSSALRGAGDTLYPMLMILGCSWLVMVLPAWLIVESENPTLSGLWLASSANIVLAGVLMLLRYWSGRWTRIHLVDVPTNGK